MNIRLFRIYSVPIRISSPEFHVSDTYSFHRWNSVGRYVVTKFFATTDSVHKNF